MSNNAKLIAALGLIIAISAGVLALSLGSTKSVSDLDLSLTAEAYYLSFNEIAGTPESSYIEKDDAKKIGETLSGLYKGKKSVNSLDDYDQVYKIAVSPVYLERQVSEIDKYSKDPIPDEDANAIYGEVIYVFDKKTIGFYDAETGALWIGKRKTGSIDIDALSKLIEANPQIIPNDDLDEQALLEEEAQRKNDILPGVFDDEEDLKERQNSN